MDIVPKSMRTGDASKHRQQGIASHSPKFPISGCSEQGHPRDDILSATIEG
jgi:hypothetical protein